MSSQERWDVVLRFIDGPLSFQDDLVCRGPVVRMGANPGPGGLKLDGYRALDARQAVITAYDGGSVSIAPVGSNQVRVAPHENVDWQSLQTIRGPVYLSPGNAFHLGPPGRGLTAIFIECRRLGVWEQRQILSDAAQLQPEVQPSNVKELDTRKGIPVWFIPAMLITAMTTAVAVIVPLAGLLLPDIQPLGPVDDGEEAYTVIEETVEVDTSLKEGIAQPFEDFIMAPNARQARWDELQTKESMWDQVYLDYVTRSMKAHAQAWRFWERLELVRDDYADVVSALREVGLPEVFAAIPYQESQYKASAQSYACAKGWWQLMPEVGHRTGLRIRNCKLRGSQNTWSPSDLAPPIGVMKNATYIANGKSCRIQGCESDERMDLVLSTRSSIELLGEAYNDRALSESGAAVQLTMLSHNVGFDDSRYHDGRVNRLNIRFAYDRYKRDNKLEQGPEFYGDNMRCTTKDEAEGIENAANRCGGYLAAQAQHYAYNITAQHFLAVCYYGLNHGDSEPFNKWRAYTRGEGYCTGLNVPEREAVAKRIGK